MIINYAGFLVEDLGEHDARRTDALEIQRTGEAAAKLLRQLVAFSHKSVIQPEVTDVAEVLVAMNGRLIASVGEDVELVVKATPEPWRISADRDQLEQVVLNLVVNAIDAMPQGGVLMIETTNVQIDETSDRRPDLSPGRYACLSLSDTGKGMSKETQARLFEPFFTTKPRATGTGLGLATVFSDLKHAGVHLLVYS